MAGPSTLSNTSHRDPDCLKIQTAPSVNTLLFKGTLDFILSLLFCLKDNLAYSKGLLST